MTDDRWAIVRFQECLQRWVDVESPPIATVKRVADWITNSLPVKPFQAGAKRMNEDPRQWSIALPFRSNEGRYVLVGYQLDADARTITCLILDEVTVHERP